MQCKENPGQAPRLNTSQWLSRPMPRDGAIIFSDLIGKLDVLRVACDQRVPPFVLRST